MMRRATRLALMLTLMATAMLLWPTSPVAAKGPLPVIEVPEQGLTVGQPTRVPVNFEWGTPDGRPPRGAPRDFWGDEPPWSILAGQENADVSTFEPLPLRHVGDDRYEVEFTPPHAGRWVLAAGAGDVPETGGRPSLLEHTKVAFDATPPATSRTWSWLLRAAVASVVAVGAAVILGRSRRPRVTRSDSRVPVGR